MPSIGSKLAEARKAAGLTPDDVLVHIRTDLPEVMWISRSTLNRFEKADQIEPWVVRYLASVYSLDDAATAERDRIFMRLMTGTDGDEGGPVTKSTAGNPALHVSDLLCV